MNSVVFTADSTTMEDRHPEGLKRTGLLAKKGASLPRRIQGLAAGLLFLTAHVPVYVGVLLFGALVSLVGAVLYIIQAAILRLTRPAGVLATSLLALVCAASPQRAHADSLADVTQLTATSPMQQTTVVFSQQTNLYAFQTDAAGTLSISLKDWGFPVPLQQLTASIMSDDQVLGSWDPSGTAGWQFELPLQSGGVFDAFVAAQAGTFYGMQLGAYSMILTFSPTSTVPLPPALDLLLGGMGLLGAVTLIERISRRRNGAVISIA
jgi:hypothetical protein